MQQITPFLMFVGQAEEAMNFYVSLFDDAEILNVVRWGSGGPGPEGGIMHAVFTLKGREFRCSDSPPVHDFTFTPSVSFFVDCTSDDEVDRLFAALSDGGEVLMPLDAYPFSQRFAWVNDRFGVSWQLNRVA